MLMVISLHILIAIMTLIGSVAAVVRPNNTLRVSSYILLAGTLVSGIALVATGQGTLTHVCTSGLVLSLATMAMTRASSVRQARLERA